jgi:DNA-binding Lrp family transcriptional regulator
LLQYARRLPYTFIAGQLRIIEGAVRRRIKKLVEEGKMQISTIVGPEDLD